MTKKLWCISSETQSQQWKCVFKFCNYTEQNQNMNKVRRQVQWIKQVLGCVNLSWVYTEWVPIVFPVHRVLGPGPIPHGPGRARGQRRGSLRRLLRPTQGIRTSRAPVWWIQETRRVFLFQVHPLFKPNCTKPITGIVCQCNTVLEGMIWAKESESSKKETVGLI